MLFFFLFHETHETYFVLIMAGPPSAQTATQSVRENRCSYRRSPPTFFNMWCVWQVHGKRNYSI